MFGFTKNIWLLLDKRFENTVELLTQHCWFCWSLDHRSYSLRESHLNVPLVPFPRGSRDRKTPLEPFSSFSIGLLYITSFSPLSTGGFALISAEPCTHSTREITEMNRAEL